MPAGRAAALICDTGAFIDYLVESARDHKLFRDAIDLARTRYVPGLVLAEVDDCLRYRASGDAGVHVGFRDRGLHLRAARGARVENGRLHLDEPTELPEGTEFELVVDDDGDDLTDQERRALHEALLTSWSSAEAGRSRPAPALIDELRRRR